MRPIDRKLKYQVDKVMRLAATGGAGMYNWLFVFICIVLVLICQRPDILINKHAYQWNQCLSSWLMFGVRTVQPPSLIPGIGAWDGYWQPARTCEFSRQLHHFLSGEKYMPSLY